MKKTAYSGAICGTKCCSIRFVKGSQRVKIKENPHIVLQYAGNPQDIVLILVGVARFELAAS